MKEFKKMKEKEKMKNLNINTFSILWLVFFVIFLSLAAFHFWQAKRTIPLFELTQRNYGNVSLKIGGLKLDEPIENFVIDFNKYIEEQNISNRKMNIASSAGYFSSSLIALFSSLLNMWWFKKKFLV